MQLEMASDICKCFTSELILEYFRANQIYNTVLHFLRQNQSSAVPFSRDMYRHRERERDVSYLYVRRHNFVYISGGMF